MGDLLTEPTYFALGTKVEGTYGTALAWADAVPRRFKARTNPIWQKAGDIITDKEEYTGFAGIAERTVRKWMTDMVIEKRLLPHDAILFTALLLGSVSSAAQGGTDAYRHDLSPQSAVDLPSVTMWQGNPLTGNRVYPGVGCSQVVISGDPGTDGGFLKLAATLMGDGSAASGVDISGGALPSDESYLAWEDCDLLIGGTFDGSDVSSGVSIKDKVKSFTLTLNNGAEREYQMGGDGEYADALIVPDIKLEDRGVIDCVIKPGDTTELAYLTSETENVVEFKAVGALADTGYYFTFSVVFPVARVLIAEPDRDRGIMNATLKINSQKDDSANDYEEIHAYGINLLTEYLGAV